MRWIALCTAVCVSVCTATAADTPKEGPQLTAMMTVGDRFVLFVTLPGQGARHLDRIGESIGPFELMAFDSAKGSADFKRGTDIHRVWLPEGHVKSSDGTVGLFGASRQIALPESAQPLLRRQVINLIQSSNFHSGPGDKFHIFTAEGVERDYRDAVAGGEYILLLLSPAQRIDTTGGEITAAEILVNLHGPGGQNCVFTIDDAGTVVSHAKYAGEIFLELKKVVAEARQ